MSEEAKVAFEGWAIVEVMGHRRLAGYVREVPVFGTAMCRIDVPGDGGTVVASPMYGGASIYCLTPCTEETARAVARETRPEPVTQWDARRLLAPTAPTGDGQGDAGNFECDCAHEDCGCHAEVSGLGKVCADCQDGEHDFAG